MGKPSRIPAQAGIRLYNTSSFTNVFVFLLDPRLRGDDAVED